MRDSVGAMDGADGMSDCVAEIAQLESRLAVVRARLISRLVRRETLGEDPSYIDQTTTLLGRNTHIKAVRRRIREAQEQGRDLGAYKRGRRYLLTQEAHADELGKQTPAGPGVIKAELPPDDDAEAIMIQKLRRLRGAK